eukprot:CAMPEP_0202386010 /NCGR_PEP_ID=MMETSP1127-20130417/64080_1 /ASSEMBLY_ACC=CAM_ASM_000462 /TAXON_ID=3047 /ORGANISM="Dunaliella tertiolecta, Strain CCMP1320" /LENGTH=528 /DNA_ID=CAMNT_0048986381 /DNA_START=250 /DNA_END=1836 /DNA_ORIENTATION=-
MTFESQLPQKVVPQEEVRGAEDPDARAEALVQRASKALEEVQAVLGADEAAGSRPEASTASTQSTSSAPSSPVVRPGPSSESNRFSAGSGVPGSSRTTREILHSALQQQKKSQRQGDEQLKGSNSSSSWSGGDGGGGSGGIPGHSPIPQRLPLQQEQEQRQLDFAEPEWWPARGLQLVSQEEELAAAARKAVLPPLQSVMELTSAYKPPTRQFEAVEAGAAQAQAAPEVGRQLEDGSGVLADGTKWEKKTEEILGQAGFRKLITTLRGWTVEGQVAWEESWWEASDWAGLRELGADKSGSTPLGAAWHETWCEKAYHDETTLELKIERTANKWARAENGNEWEEKWGEKHAALGEVNKYADKWAKEGDDVWHERWGEDYDGKGACKKWTDKWAERLVAGGASEQWGDKWTEEFGHGQGVKHGEVWSAGSNGERYNRWWNEQHYGDGRVRKWGDSTHGEFWDDTEWMDTYYNPVPHFGFDLAVRHSPNLWQIPVRPAGTKGKASGGAASGSGEGSSDDDDLGMGMSALD